MAADAAGVVEAAPQRFPGAGKIGQMPVEQGQLSAGVGNGLWRCVIANTVNEVKQFIRVVVQSQGRISSVAARHKWRDGKTLFLQIQLNRVRKRNVVRVIFALWPAL